MTLTTLIIQILLTLPLTFIINTLSKKDNNTIHRIIVPTVYTIILAALIPSIKENIFLIVIFELFIRNFYISNFSNKANNITKFLIEALLSVSLCLFTYNQFISKIDNVLPTPESIKPFLWFLMIVYIYTLCKPQINKVNQMIPEKRTVDKENTIMLFAKYKNKYHKVIKTKNILITNLVYSIMIYNGITKPTALRKATELKGIITTKPVPYGIMQVTSKIKITDEESIGIVVSNFEKQIKDSKLKENDKVDKLLSEYNNESKQEIKEIYDEITEFLKK
ncbi:MAG: hypothetical protein ACI4OP_07740 [Candidatus Coprovivens sp.]